METAECSSSNTDKIFIAEENSGSSSETGYEKPFKKQKCFRATDISNSVEDKKVKPKRKRRYLPSKKAAWPWITYDPVNDVVKCEDYIRGEELNLEKIEKRSDDALTIRGFRNWDKGPSNFKNHEKSECHQQAVESMSAVNRGCNIVSQ